MYAQPHTPTPTPTLTPGDELLYLTTEAMHEDAAGRLAVLSAPVTALVDDLPLCPPLTGQLVLTALNLWMGCRC